MLQCPVTLPPPNVLPIASKIAGRRLNFVWGTILAAPRTKNPCANWKKYVKYLLTKRALTGRRLGGGSQMLAAVIDAVQGRVGAIAGFRPPFAPDWRCARSV